MCPFADAPNPSRPPREIEPVALLAQLRRTQPLCLILDYDGTLVPLAPRPELACPDPALLCLLDKLSARHAVHLVSGRLRGDLDQWFGTLAVGLHAEHGAWSRMQAHTPWKRVAGCDAWPADLLHTLRQACALLAGSWLEVKTASIALHYRQTPQELATREVPRLRASLSKLAELYRLDLMEVSKVLEIKIPGVSKALAVNAILRLVGQGSTVIAMGDDAPDEEMFRALPAGGISVHVGAGASIAMFRFVDQARTRAFLEGLS